MTPVSTSLSVFPYPSVSYFLLIRLCCSESRTTVCPTNREVSRQKPQWEEHLGITSGFSFVVPDYQHVRARSSNLPRCPDNQTSSGIIPLMYPYSFLPSLCRFTFHTFPFNSYAQSGSSALRLFTGVFTCKPARFSQHKTSLPPLALLPLSLLTPRHFHCRSSLIFSISSTRTYLFTSFKCFSRPYNGSFRRLLHPKP